VDALASPGFQRSLQLVLALVAGLGAAMFLGALWMARRPVPAQTRVRRRRIGAVGLFVTVAAGVAFVVLATPVEPDPGAPSGAGAPSVAGPPAAPEEDAVSPRRFSSARLPALSLDAPDGWTLAFDEKGHKLTASSATARLLISTAFLSEAVDVPSLLARMADTQRTLGFDVGAILTDRIGDLPAGAFLSTGPARSVCTWMVKRDTRLATSVICTADGKATARDACRPVVAKIRWRTPARP
jgi:hypothetical protein